MHRDPEERSGAYGCGGEGDGSYHSTGTPHRSSCVPTDFILMATLQGMDCHHPHCMGEQTEAQRG